MIRRAERQSPLRKVAILVRALDSAAAERLLSAMSTAEAAEVRALAQKLDDCSPEESEAVVHEFLRASGRSVTRTSVDAGVELELSSSAEAALASENPMKASVANPNSDGSASVRRPLHFVTMNQAVRLAPLFEREQDAIGAALLAMLEPEVAARVLERLSIDRQRTLLNRLAKIGRPEPLVIEELSKLVREQLQYENEVRDELGLEAVQAILGQVDHDRREALLGDSQLMTPPRVVTPVQEPVKAMTSNATEPLRKMAAEAAASSQPSIRRDEATASPETRAAEPSAADAIPLTSLPTAKQQVELQQRFDSLSQWSEESLFGLLKRVPPRVLRIAMVGASQKLIGRVLRPLRRADAERLRAEWERPGAVRLADIAVAQQAILKLADKLAMKSTELFV